MERIRMLKCVAMPRRYFETGTVLNVPDHLDEETAKNWVKAGLAMEDKVIDRAPETKNRQIKEPMRRKRT